jgi:hypothetical protein
LKDNSIPISGERILKLLPYQEREYYNYTHLRRENTVANAISGEYCSHSSLRGENAAGIRILGERDRDCIHSNLERENF